MSKLNEQYNLLFKQLATLLDGETNMVTNMAQFSALIFNNIEDLNWAGFYLVGSGNSLQLGPFQGQVACTKIPIGHGVCGLAAKKRETVTVADIDQFEGHIACDSRSRSEIVCPVIAEDQLIAVLDIDSPLFNRFSQQDIKGIENLVEILVNKTRWSLSY
ncbi:MAG: GAF domain-containing protein [Kangiellaceae bacterium]|nr:GAF domain-containing protein [Kangiellaceae bacterium]